MKWIQPHVSMAPGATRFPRLRSANVTSLKDKNKKVNQTSYGRSKKKPQKQSVSLSAAAVAFTPTAVFFLFFSPMKSLPGCCLVLLVVTAEAYSVLYPCRQAWWR